MKRKSNNFSRRLRNLFILTGLRQEILAYRAGVSIEMVRQWESGAKLPNVEQFKAIASFFGLPYTWFLDGRDIAPSDMAASLGLSEDTVCLLMKLAASESEEVLDAVDDAVYAVVAVVNAVYDDLLRVAEESVRKLVPSETER